MNKSVLKTFAISARKELLKKVEAKAMKIGITEETIKKADIESSDAIFIDGKQLSKEEKVQRDNLITRIRELDFNQVMQEVAYTWFNRFTALRFMEVNEHLPTQVRVLSSSNSNSAEPDMLNEALELDLEIDKEYVYDLKLNNKTEDLFKYLIIKHCNQLNTYLPFMFKTIDDYTEILFPEGILGKDSFISQITNTNLIPEDNWRKVEVIGWLYQYYIAEEKDRVIKAKKKYKKEEIPFATQLFTPDWIVRYMVQNTLGRYWIESHSENQDLLDNWEFYLENPNSEMDFEKELAPYINKELKVEDIKCLDPAMGSGHILVYMFDVLYEIYSKCGYMEREIPRLIIENNLYGLDIDDRAYQLACFSVVMKALEYNSRFFRSIEREGLELNLASLQETNILDEEDIAYIAGENKGENFDKIKEFIEQFKHAKTFGTLIKVQEFDKDLVKERIEYMNDYPANDLFEEQKRSKGLALLPSLLKQAEIMVGKYDILVSNPPYLSNLYMNDQISSFVKKEYPNSKTDIYACFIERGTGMVKNLGHLGFISPFSWMFLSSFQKLREEIVAYKTLSSIVQIEYNAFEVAAVQVASFTMRNCKVKLPAECINLSDFPGAQNQPLKTLEAIKDSSVPYRYTSYTDDYNELEGKPIAYWISDNIIQIFKKGTKIKEIGDLKVGLQTGDNEKFLKVWHEVDINKIGFNSKNTQEAKESKKKWFPHNKGGEFRRYYGNKIFVVDWENDGYDIKNYKNDKGKLRSRPQNISYYFKEGITWSDLTAGTFSARYVKEGSIFDTTGPTLFVNDREDLLYMLGYMNSKVFQKLLEISCSGMHYNNGVIAELPVYINIDSNESIS